jgi:hypothetical protein
VQAEELYRHLGRLIEAAPKFSAQGKLSPEEMRWLGRARALILEGGDLNSRYRFETFARDMHSAMRLEALQWIMSLLYEELAAAELKAPASAQGAFIPASNRFDAFAAISKILQASKTDLLIVDPYLDETILTEFGGSIPDTVFLRLLADQASVKPSITPAARA